MTGRIKLQLQTALSSLLFTLIIFGGCSGGGSTSGGSPGPLTGSTPGAEQAVGERLFLETRFAQT